LVFCVNKAEPNKLEAVLAASGYLSMKNIQQLTTADQI